eukprot:TRINITY_DN2181_c0_g1_i3.p1 TRINITY_DN2181_c0_g1~~TRINITY_DN2181_c0_g1_i3.p1  ORF type:complete len:212 (+),score=47.16 TRINITY_DN2181_c0_g1_i3:404-1039(+)
MRDQLEIFQANLERFAKKYKRNINKDPAFRTHFNEMCSKIGVDPLSSSKGFWAQLLGVGDFYYELGVQIVEICIHTRPLNGGLIGVESVLKDLQKKRSSSQNRITTNDIEKAVNKLSVLGNGFKVIAFGAKRMIQSVPTELNNDHTMVITMAQDAYFSKSTIMNMLQWDEHRADMVIDHLVKEGIAWVDEQAEETLYWFPSIWMNIQESDV